MTPSALLRWIPLLSLCVPLRAEEAVRSASSTSYTFELNDQFFFGKFGQYNSVDITLSADTGIDFWVTDEQSFDLWKDQETIPTAKMFSSTYCNNCQSHITTFTNPTPGFGDYYWVVSAVFPERTDADGTISLVYQGGGYYTEPEEEEDSQATCFSGAATVQREDGTEVLLRELSVGERVLAVDLDGEVGYSPVLALPHADRKGGGKGRGNKHYSTYVQIHTGQEGNVLEMTRDHLLPTCPLVTSPLQQGRPASASCSCPSSHTLNPLYLTAAKDVTPSMCILISSSTSLQWTPVSSVSKHTYRGGLYSLVTEAAYPVVSGVTASPYASSHLLGHAFHRYLSPLLGSSSSVAQGVIEVLNAVEINRALRWLTYGATAARNMARHVMTSSIEL